MNLVYPAVFYPCEVNPGFTVIVPDLPGCISEGDSLTTTGDVPDFFEAVEEA